MLSKKHQKGVVNLGIFAVLFLLGALVVGTKLVSNKDLTSFNISEKAAGSGKLGRIRKERANYNLDDCHGPGNELCKKRGCEKGYEYKWRRTWSGSCRCVAVKTDKCK